MKLAVACFAVALCVTGPFVGPSRASAQIQTPPWSWQDDRPKPPEKKRKPDKMDFLHLASEGYLAGGTWFDAWTTVKGLDHPTMAYEENGTFLMRDVVTEDGWARCFGNRDAFTASAANVALSAGMGELDRRFYRRGGRWRFVAVGVDLFRATSSTLAGIHNARMEAGIDQHVRKMTGYRGVIIWSH